MAASSRASARRSTSTRSTTPTASSSPPRSSTTRMPRADGIPFFHFETRNVPSKTNAFGIKGAGEAGSIGSCPAVMNGIIDALNRGLRHHRDRHAGDAGEGLEHDPGGEGVAKSCRRVAIAAPLTRPSPSYRRKPVSITDGSNLDRIPPPATPAIDPGFRRGDAGMDCCGRAPRRAAPILRPCTSRPSASARRGPRCRGGWSRRPSGTSAASCRCRRPAACRW